MRDLIVFGVVMVTLPMAFRRPYIGLLLFSWLAYMRPQDLCWGFARDMRFSFYVGATMLVGWWVNEAEARPFWRRDVRTVCMLLLAVTITISLSMAQKWLNDKYVTTYYIEFLKIIVVALFTTGQVDSKQRLRILLWTIALCLAFYGVKNGVIGVLRGGGHIIRGPGGMLEDNNDFALALVMNLPLLFYLGRTERPLIRVGTKIAIVLTLITIILTESRGAFLATTVTLLVLAWQSRKLVQAGATLAMMVVLFFAFAPQAVFDRLATLKEGTQEASAHARWHSWHVALNMIKGNPFFGVGLRNYRDNWATYAENYVPGKTFAYVAHNSYLQIWAEGGSISFLIYLILLASVYVSAFWLQRLARGRPDLTWVGDYARMMVATTIGFMVGATFLNRGHFDLVYHWFALMSALVFVARLEYRRSPAAAMHGAPSGVSVRWRPMPGPSMLPRWGR